MKKVLVVFEEVPQSLELIVLDVEDSVAAKLATFHNHYVNDTSTPDELSGEINNFFYPDHGYFKFHDQCVKEPIVNGSFDLIVKTGFFN